MEKLTDIMLVVDTTLVTSAEALGLEPRALEPHQDAVLIATPSSRVQVQGLDVFLTGALGDRLRFFGVSGSNNFEDQVLLLGVRFVEGAEVLTTAMPVQEPFVAVVPSGPDEMLPGQGSEQVSWYFESEVASHGLGSYALDFSLYGRDALGLPVESAEASLTINIHIVPERTEPLVPERI